MKVLDFRSIKDKNFNVIQSVTNRLRKLHARIMKLNELSYQFSFLIELLSSKRKYTILLDPTKLNVYISRALMDSFMLQRKAIRRLLRHFT